MLPKLWTLWTKKIWQRCQQRCQYGSIWLARVIWTAQLFFFFNFVVTPHLCFNFCCVPPLSLLLLFTNSILAVTYRSIIRSQWRSQPFKPLPSISASFAQSIGFVVERLELKSFYDKAP
jgi:hypothetical protein